MAKVPDVERRLQNWARWRMGPSISSAGTMRVDGEGWDAPTVIPTNSADAEETERAVQGLDARLRDAVIDVYTGSGDLKAKARRRGIELNTLHARVDQAHQILNRVFREARAQADAHRKRVEALQQTARPPSIFTSGAAAPSLSSAAPRSRLADWLAERRALGGAVGGAGGFTK